MRFSDFFRTDGTASMMRLGFFVGAIIIGCIGGMGLAFVDVIMNQGKNLAGVAGLVGAIVGSLGISKAVQSFSEPDETPKP